MNGPDNKTSRRSVLGALAIFPAIAALPAVAQPRADRSQWDRAFAAMEQAKAADEADDARHEPIWQAFRAASEAVPHVTLEPDPYSGKYHRLSTENWQDVRDARRDTRGRYWIDPQYPDVVAHYALLERLVAAADARQAEIDRIDARLGYSASAERNEAMGEAYLDRASELMAILAPDAAALAWKVEYVFGEEEGEADRDYSGSYTMEWIGPMVRDARRLLTGEA